ncbi:MAG: hypothetical protein WBV94_25620 [Blastocatellia bacterium]
MKRVAEKISPRAIIVSICFSAVVASLTLFGGAKSRRPAPEPDSQPQAIQPSATTTAASKPEKSITAETPHQVAIQAAVARVFEGTVTLDQNRFLVGDFDKDGSQDLVAVVRPIKEKLASINDELARWKLEDPRKIRVVKSIKDLQKNVQSPPAPVLATPNDLLLAVVHGHGAYGWRNTEATNAYLLKNAVGANMTLEPLKAALAATKESGELFTLRGDVVKQTLAGETGFIFWTGADYAWHSLKERNAPARQPVAQLRSANKGGAR